MNITMFELDGEIAVNCYIVEENGQCFIIDPGYYNTNVVNYIKENNLIVRGMLLTHGHFDHVGGIDCFNVPVYLHEKDIEVISDDIKNCSAFFGVRFRYNLHELQIVPITENTTFQLGVNTIKVIFTPGHTQGGVTYSVNNALFTGDTLFASSVGRGDFPTGNLIDLKHSLVSLIDNHSDDVIVYPGHGPSTTIGTEQLNNQYYLQWKDSLIEH